MTYIPENPKIYHIVHIDRLPSIVREGGLLCDAEVIRRPYSGTVIGMSGIKERRLEIPLNSYPNLYVGECVPFYFCPRSVMLYLIYQGNHPDLGYKNGQESIIHLETDLRKTVDWAEKNKKRWVFTLSNAGSRYFEDRCNLVHLNDLGWDAIQARDWRNCKEEKQAEFLIEHDFPLHLIERIGVHSQSTYTQVSGILATSGYKPHMQILRDWYY